MAKQWNLDQRIRKLERQLEALEPAESVQTHIQGQDGRIEPPLSEAEATGRKDCIICRVVDGRDPKRKH